MGRIQRMLKSAKKEKDQQKQCPLKKNPPNPQNLQLKKDQKIKTTYTKTKDYKGKRVLFLRRAVSHFWKLSYFFLSIRFKISEEELPDTPFSTFYQQKNHVILRACP